MYMYAYINEYTSVHMYVCEYKEETLINKTGDFFPKVLHHYIFLFEGLRIFYYYYYYFCFVLMP